MNNAVLPGRFCARAALVLALALAPSHSVRAQASGVTDSAAVHAVLQRYLHGLRFNDVAAFRDAFWPGAKLLWARKDGSLGELTQEAWYKGFEGSAGKEEPGDFRIVSIEVTGTIASARVRETYPTSEYVNVLSLVRTSGRWWIVNKVYWARPR